jgi:hypothetical protein
MQMFCGYCKHSSLVASQCVLVSELRPDVFNTNEHHYNHYYYCCCLCMHTHTYTYNEQGIALHMRPALYRAFVQKAAAVTATAVTDSAAASAADAETSADAALQLLPSKLDLQDYAELVAAGMESSSAELIAKDLPRAFGRLGQCPFNLSISEPSARTSGGNQAAICNVEFVVQSELSSSISAVQVLLTQ